MCKSLLFLLLLLSSFSVFSQAPQFYITNGGFNYAVIEGNTYNFTVNVYSVSTTDIIIDVATVSETADASDFTPLTTTVTIPAGQLSSNPLSIVTMNDATIEPNEYFYVEANVTSGNTSNSSLSRSIYLYDNDTTPTVNIGTTISILEGNSTSRYLQLSNYFNEDIEIAITTSAGTADASDYVETNISLTIPAGENYTQFPITTTQDNLTEADEIYTIEVNITSGNATNNTIAVTVTIIDNDTIPTLLPITDQSITESYNKNVYVNLNRAYNSNITIQFSTTNGTAGNNDYNSSTQTKIIPAGSKSTFFLVQITDDDLDEPEETINLTATVTSGNTTNNLETGTLSIIDNDGLPDFKLYPYNNPNNSQQTYGDSIAAEEGYPLKFYPRLTHPSPLDTDITITTTNGTADATDFTTSTIMVTIPAGQYSNYQEELTYATILDQLDEDDENLFINAQVTSNSTFNTNSTVEAVIFDNYTINAQPDAIISVLQVGSSFQLLDNDTFEGLPVDVNNLIISLIGNNTSGATLEATGILTVPENTPQGYYYLEYQICESSNPTSCDTAGITIRIESPLDVDYTIAYVDFNGDGYTSVGDTIEYEFTLTNNGNAPITNIYPEVQYLDLDIVGGPLAILNAGQTDTTTFTATHIITQDDINFGYYGSDQEGLVFYGTYYSNQVQGFGYNPEINFQLQESDGLELNAFVDTNSNGTQDFGELNFPLGQFDYEVNNDGVERHLYVSPHYLYESNPTTTYNVSYTVDPDYAANNTTSASYSNISVPTGSGITALDFPITLTPYDDLSVVISAVGNNPVPVPGFTYWNFISYTNNSNQTVSTGTINFTKDSALSVLNVNEISQNWFSYTPAPITTTATGFNYTFTNLQPYQTKSLWVRLQVPTLPTVSLGQLVTNEVAINLPAGDIIPSNNTASFTQTIVGSYDPNDVTERHGPEIMHANFSTEEYLTYTIRFENTGTANAINIRVEDLLDEQLDESTLKMVDASHSYTLERVGKDLEWNFFGINLPPSEDENSPVGHGYVVFKIKPFPDYAIGDIIPNTAEIYFDFNPAIITNTWTTEFVEESLSVADNAFVGLSVFPNPVKDELFVINNTIIDDITITSILGRTILTKTINTLYGSLDLESLSSGIYLINVSSNGQEKTLKIIKE